MRILIIHERYRHRGGEDAAVDAELALFTQGGVAVDLLLEDNRRMPDGMGLGVARHLLWSAAGHAAAFLRSDLASGITGEIVYVDCGYSQVGMTLDERRPPCSKS